MNRQPRQATTEGGEGHALLKDFEMKTVKFCGTYDCEVELISMQYSETCHITWVIVNLASDNFDHYILFININKEQHFNKIF